MPRRPADQTVNRQDILEAAARVFHAQGYHGATMQDIGAAVGLTPGTLYHHFKGGKEAILLAVLEAGLGWLTQELETIVDRDLDPEEKLRQVIRTHIVSITEHLAVAALTIFEVRTLLSLPDVPQTYLAQRDLFEQLYRTVIREGIEAGSFRPVDVGVFTRTLLGAANWVSMWYRPEGRLSGANIADEVAGIFLNALRAQAKSES